MRAHPIFARFYDRLARSMWPVEVEHRTELVSGLEGRVLEVGAGTGLNFQLYPAGVEVVAVEPEPNMANRAVGRLGEATGHVRLLRAVAEALPFPDRSFDAAVVSLVLCSVRDPRVAVSEIRRVLRPDGELRIFEHVRSQNPRHARWQDWLTPIWRSFSAGCHPNRDTAATLRSAGFDVDVRRIPIGPVTPARPHILGAATPR
ncbi:MAG: class I SAM-dependent methyltransferase [Actinomycetota bacterium]